MGNFKFKSNILSLNIDGNLFEVTMTPDFSGKLKELSAEAGIMARGIIGTPSSGSAEVSAFLSYIIDTLVGEGTTDIIFRSRERDVFDLYDIISYICDEFSDYRLARLNDNV